MWVLISSRSISLIFVKLGEQFSIHSGFYLMSFFIISLSHVTHLRLVMVKIFHRKWGILNHTELPLFYRISVASSEGFRMPPFNHVRVLSTLDARDFSCADSPLVSSACGRQSSFSNARKNLWYPGYVLSATFS